MGRQCRPLGAVVYNTVVATISVGDHPTYVTFAPIGSRAYVANSNANTASVLNAIDNTVVGTITVGDYPTGLAVTQDGSLLYAANMNGASASVVNTVVNTADNSVLHTISLTPVDIAVMPRSPPPGVSPNATGARGRSLAAASLSAAK